jgi:formylglycine-generating enzyme required for sulfatase activity
MIVVPAGEFTIGSPETENSRKDDEGPQQRVILAKPFAVSKFEITFDQWDACVAVGGCARVSDAGFGRGTRPVIDVSWDDAQRYAAWFSRMTGKTYRLLSEAEWEYAARAGSTTAYSWGNEIGSGNANCNGCGSQWDSKQTAPVGSFAPNEFGLYDMHGNVWEWVEDCYQNNHEGVPTDGSAREANCDVRVVRGGSYYDAPQLLRSANRDSDGAGDRVITVGFRLARTLNP